MKIALDENNFLLAFGFEDEAEFGNVIEAELPTEQFFKPKWQNGWVEGLSQSEIDELKNNDESETTEVEELAQQISDLEISGMAKDEKISALEHESELLGQQLSDLEIQILGGNGNE